MEGARPSLPYLLYPFTKRVFTELGSEAMKIEPNGDFRTAAATIRQMYLAYVQAGFTEEQAMQLVKHFLPNGGGNA